MTSPLHSSSLEKDNDIDIDNDSMPENVPASNMPATLELLRPLPDLAAVVGAAVVGAALPFELLGPLRDLAAVVGTIQIVASQRCNAKIQNHKNSQSSVD